MDRDMCLNSSCVMKTKCLRYMGKTDIVQAYTNFKPLRNTTRGFSCVGRIDIHAHHNKKYRPKNSANYVDLIADSKVIEEAPDYRITSDHNIISVIGNPKIMSQSFNKGMVNVYLRVGTNQTKRFSVNKLIKKYYPETI